MKFYEITYMVEEKAYKRLSVLAERYEKVKGWNEKEMLQFAVSAMNAADIEAKLQFLEKQVVLLEKEWQEQKEEKSGQSAHISEKEREKCQKVVNAFARELDDVEVMVVEAGRFGFVKLMHYKEPYGFGDVETYTDSQELFLDLWEEWYESQLLELTAGTPIEELDYDGMFRCLPREKQEELLAKREYFAEKAEISIR